MLRIAIILGSTRPNRVGEGVAKWVFETAKKRNDAEFGYVDIKDYDLPLLDEPEKPSSGNYANDHTKNWASTVNSFDAFIFVTPEYNHSIPGALKNAIDFLYKEWNNKVAGFVSYGGSGGTRSVEHLRLVMAELQIADVRQQLVLSLRNDFENFTLFKPAAWHEKTLNSLVDQVISWGTALKEIRTTKT